MLRAKIFLFCALGMGLWLFQSKAFAYPSFIGFGYSACSTCHFNPLGNGPLTDYGRALAAGTIAARPPFLKLTDEQLAEKSGFLGSPDTLPEWLRIQLGYRGLYYIYNVAGNSSTRYINMKGDISVVLKTPDSKWLAVGNVGYAPIPRNARAGEDVSELISREHYVGYRPSKKWGFYGGFMDIAYGIRIPDHTAYSRSYTKLTQNDQTHGLLLHTAQTFGDGYLHLIAGNLNQDYNLRQMGVSTHWDFEITPYMRAGGSGLMTFGKYRKRQMGGGHFKFGIEGGHAFLFDIGLINEMPETVASTLGLYMLAQSHVRLMRGLNLLMTGEMYTQDLFDDRPQTFRVSPGLQYFAAQRLEFRVDFQAARSTNSNPVNKDIFSILAQVNLWL